MARRLPRENPTPPEDRDKIDAGVDAGAFQEILAAVGTLAAEVRELQAERGFRAQAQDPRLFGNFQHLGEALSGTEALRRARAADGEPPAKTGNRQHRRAMDGRSRSGQGSGRPPEQQATISSRCCRN